MTVSSPSPRMPLYTGNGVTTAYPYTFRVFAATDVVVKVKSGGVETTKTYLTDYTVSGVASYSGGYVTFLTAPASGDSIAISRSVPLTQTTDLQNQGPYYAQTIEDMSDRSTMEAQQIQAQLDRTLQIRETDYGIVSTALPVPSASSLLGWNSTATGITNITTLTGISVLGNPIVDAYTAGVNFTAGSTTVLTLSQAPGSKNQTVVTFNGLVQHKSSYSTSGVTLTFSSAIPAGVTQIEVAQVTTLAVPLVTPVAGSITASMLAGGSVTQAALASDVQYQVDTIAGLRALSAGAYNTVYVRAYSTALDGGHGIFRWDSASAVADNGGTVITPASAPATGRWVRVTDAVWSVKWFNVKGDGVTDDTAGINAAILALPGTNDLTGIYAAVPSNILLFPPGVYKITSRILVQKNNVAIRGSGQFSTTIKFIGASIINECIKFLDAQYCEISDIGIDGGMPYNPTRSETYGAKAGLACDLTPFFTLKNVYIANTRLQGMRCMHLWESYVENLQVRNTGYFSDGTLAGRGAAIHFSNDAAQKESSVALGPGYESDNTTFVKCTLVPVGCLVRCDAPTQNITFIDPIMENRDFAAFFSALGESKWYINSADQFHILGGYCYGHEHSFACNAILFEIVAQNPGVLISDYYWYTYNPTGGYFPEVTTGFNIDPVYPVTVDNFIINDLHGKLTTPLTISVNGPVVNGSIFYKAPSTIAETALFSGTSIQRWNGKIRCYNSAANTHTSADYTETERKWDRQTGNTLEAFQCRAWVSFNGATAAILGSKNVTSVVRNSAGNYTVTFTNAMPDTAFTAFANGNASATNTDRAYVGGRTAATCNVINGTGGVPADATVIDLVVFR